MYRDHMSWRHKGDKSTAVSCQTVMRLRDILVLQYDEEVRRNRLTASRTLGIDEDTSKVHRINNIHLERD